MHYKVIAVCFLQSELESIFSDLMHSNAYGKDGKPTLTLFGSNKTAFLNKIRARSIHPNR